MTTTMVDMTIATLVVIVMMVILAGLIIRALARRDDVSTMVLSGVGALTINLAWFFGPMPVMPLQVTAGVFGFFGLVAVSCLFCAYHCAQCQRWDDECYSLLYADAATADQT